MLKPSNYSKAKFEKYLLACLYVNYPHLKEYQDLVKEINETYYSDNPYFQLSFEPHFTWKKGNKSIIKIGIRCANELVSAKKTTEEDNIDEILDYANDDNNFKRFKDSVLKRFELNLSKDVKSSVPRITLSLNTGEWVPEEIDIYKVIWEMMINNSDSCNSNSLSSTLVQKFETIRDAIKKLHMRGYFDSEAQMGNHTCRAMGLFDIDNGISPSIKDAIKDEVYDVMFDYKNAIITAEGGYLYDSEIFYHESCIYLLVLKWLLDNGFYVWECYDAFYAKKEGVTQEEYEQLVTCVVTDIANEYIINYLSENV